MLEKIKSLKIMKPVKTAYKYLRYGECPKFTKPQYFLNNSRNQKVACFILAGYKSFTWEIVFKRIKEFASADIDVCIVSSGVYSEELNSIAKNNSWSYISFKRNNVCLALNSAIKCFPEASHFFKLDEDIFVTKDFFSNLPGILREAKEKYFPAFSAPLIPINGYGYSKILEKLNLSEEYSSRFESPKISAGPWMQIENNLEVAKFMWGDGGFVPQIDRLDNYLRNVKTKNYRGGGGGSLYAQSVSRSAQFIWRGAFWKKSVISLFVRETEWELMKSFCVILLQECQRQLLSVKHAVWGT